MTIRAAYQGIEGAHSDIALGAYFDAVGKAHERVGVPTFRHVATTVIGGKADVGLLPIDNAIAGTVRDGYDLLAQYDLVPICEIQWRMDHRLLAVEGAELSGIREVRAHPLVIAECGRFLGTLAGARIVPVEDTGLAAKEVSEAKDPTKAAIAPPEAATRYGLAELAANVADHPDNFTRFLLFRAPRSTEEVMQLGHPPAAHRKTSLLLATKHEHGALATCLSVLAGAGLNLAKLESRPKLGRKWEYLFYLDIEGDVASPEVAAGIAELRKKASSVQVIGSYDVGSALGEPEEGHHAAISLAPAPAVELPKPSKNYPKASRATRPKGSRFPVGDVMIGGDEFVVIAGPCSVESKDQVLATAKAVAAHGARLLRGGAFKPRTNPYAFMGLGWEGVRLLAEAGRATGLPIVSEVMSVDQVERMAREVDVLQVGARNMQNYDLLRALGQVDRPVLLKRGLSASLEELLAASEYILAGGNPHVALCERGIRTFETATRNTLDLSAVPVLKERSHLPVIVDPSHGVGVRRWIRPLCRAAKAVGADGIIVEVHPNPAEAKSDADQALTFSDFAQIMEELEQIPSGM